MRVILSGVLTILLCTGASAQEFSGGFRAGLNFVTFSGPHEMSEDGQTEYEMLNRTTGFHVGATFALAFTDLVGIKADVMYSQKGVEIEYDDTPAYFYLYTGPEDVDGTRFFGQRTSDLDVLNSYVDIPVTAYYKLGNFEIEGGVSAGFLVGSRVSGGVTYTDIPGFNGIDFEYTVNGNYSRDEPGTAGVLNSSNTFVPGITDPLPDLVGAYYNSDRNDKRYGRLDFGLVAGLSYYLNNGLFIGGRYQFGLTDITKGENDRKISSEPGNLGRTFNTEDKDYTRSIQVSIGFRF